MIQLAILPVGPACPGMTNDARRWVNAPVRSLGLCTLKIFPVMSYTAWIGTVTPSGEAHRFIVERHVPAYKTISVLEEQRFNGASWWNLIPRISPASYQQGATSSHVRGG